MKYIRSAIFVSVFVVIATILAGPNCAEAATAKQLDRDAKKALKEMIDK